VVSTMIGVRQFDARISRCFSASLRVAASSTRRAEDPRVRLVDQSSAKPASLPAR
jgi:hypothetical protein